MIKIENENETEIETKETQKSQLEEAKETVAALKEQNKILAENLNRADQLHAEQMLGGTADAGGQELTEEQKLDASAKKLIAGSGFEDELFPEK